MDFNCCLEGWMTGVLMVVSGSAIDVVSFYAGLIFEPRLEDNMIGGYYFDEILRDGR